MDSDWSQSDQSMSDSSSEGHDLKNGQIVLA